MLAVNVLFIRNHSHSNSPPSIFTVYYVFFGLVLVGNGLTVMTGMCCIWMGKDRKVTDFPIPRIFCVHCCDNTRNQETSTLEGKDEEAKDSCCGKIWRFFCIFLALYFFSLFLILLGFHSVYIILGTIASPIVALARIAFHITAFLCLVAFMALFLKFTNKSRCDIVCKKSRSPRKILVAIFQYIPPVMAAFILVVCVLGFGCFYYLFMTLVKDYQHKGDFLSILGTFIPSALLTFFAYCGNKLVNCMSAEKIDCGITTDIAEVENKDGDKKNRTKKITDAEGKTDTSSASSEVKTAAGPEGAEVKALVKDVEVKDAPEVKAVVKDAGPEVKAVAKDIGPKVKDIPEVKDVPEVKVVNPAASSSASSEGLEIGSKDKRLQVAADVHA